MNGARILLLLGLVLVGLIWAALVGPSHAEDDRGWEESERAFVALAEELNDFDPLYAKLSTQGLMLDLKATTQGLRESLARLRSERLELRDDASVPEGKRLPAYRELAQRAKDARVRVLGLRQSVRARLDFFEDSDALLNTVESQRDLLAEQVTLSEGQARSREVLAALFAELEARARQATVLMTQDPQQGEIFAKSVVKDLASLDSNQKALLAELDG
ncbi:MAG: hypothetical protein DHS20C15_03440 [Planctomycetota bacterium]|nr:MAG: hypothetical protein DHS20C15_03440 [Planctomycetota bacterium]